MNSQGHDASRNDAAPCHRLAVRTPLGLLIPSLLLPLLLSFVPLARAQNPTTITLAVPSRPALPIVIASGASERVRAAARQLSRILGQIAGTQFEITTGDGTTGLALGLPKDFPQISLAPAQAAALAAANPTQREDYLLESHPGGLYALGATDLAVEHAVWDLLYRLGYRQFFPGAHWEVIPHQSTLAISISALQHPDYVSRRIWFGFGLWDYNKQPYEDWCAKNRATQGIELSSGHVYENILKANKAEFAAHPEYLGLVGGVRKSSKFCIANPGLRRLVAQDALRRVAKNPDADSLSMEPSDGGGWCECDACAKLGSVTDRALLLANEVAAAISAKYPGRLVGLYAYNYHSAPPSIQARPDVVVSLATAFIKNGTWEEMLGGWPSKASLLGIREYYSVNVWDRDLPAAARGANLDYLKRTIPDFHAKGARFFSAESSDNWGPNGLGYYLSARMMWDVHEADQVNALVEDFLARAFGPAREPMREFYRQLDGSQPHLIASDQLGRIFRALEQARALAGSAEIQARLGDLLLYARYVDLYQRYAQAKGGPRQQAFEALIRHAWRMRATMLIHAKALYRDLVKRDKSVSIPANAQWNIPEGKNPWKSSAPFAETELAAFLKEGIERYPLAQVDFKPIAFSGDLVPASRLKLPEVPAGQFGPARGRQTWYTHVAAAPATIEMRITGGLIEHYRNRGNVRVELWKLGGASQTGEQETLAAQDRSVPPDGKEHTVKLTVKEPGLYKLTLDDGDDRTRMQWACPLPLTIQSTLDAPMNKNYTDLWTLYFYVPKGTKVVGLFGGESGEVRDSADRPLFWFNGRAPNYYSVEVPQGEDGKLWRIRYGRGAFRLLTVPPCFARSAAELLLPAEVVARDAAQ